MAVLTKSIQIKTSNSNGEEVKAPEKEPFCCFKNKNVHTRNPSAEKQLKRVCATCGNGISNQHTESRFCIAKYVGKEAAHKCLNLDSNRRNNRKRKIAKINSRGVLFDVEPFILNMANTKEPNSSNKEITVNKSKNSGY